MACEVADGTPITELHFHAAAAWRGRIHQLAVGNQLHALLHGAHCRVRHPLVGMAVLERHAASHQRQRDDVLAVDIRHRAVVDNASPVLRKLYDNALHIPLIQPMLATELEERIERSLNRIADGERLDCSFGDEKATSQSRNHFLRFWLCRQCLQRIVLAVQHVPHSGKPQLNHDGRGDAIAGAHAGKVECLFNVLGIAHPAPNTRDLLRGVRKRVAHALFIEPGQRGGGRHRSHRRARAFRTAVTGAHAVRSERQQKTTADVVTERDRGEQLRSRSAFALGHRERRRHDGAAGMSFCHRLEVIGLVGMREHAVDQSGIHRRGHDVGGQDDRFRGAALRACITDRHLSGFQMRSRHHRRQRVQNAMPGFPLHVRREIALACLRHVARQLAGDIRLGHSISLSASEPSTALRRTDAVT